MSTSATVKLEADVVLSPRASAPSYTDLTAYLRDVPSVRRGRAYELADIEPGTASFVLDNIDRRFDPTNTVGPYYPGIKPMIRFRLSATLSAVTYYVFSGYALAFPPVWNQPDISTVTVPCVDGFGPLALMNVTGVWAQEDTGARFGHVLDAIGFPTGTNRVLDVGRSQVAAATFVTSDNKKALDHTRDVERTENGLISFDGQGRAIFKNRANLQAAQGTSQATFDNAAGSLWADEINGDVSDKLIYNTVQVDNGDGSPITVTDTVSEGNYWPRTVARRVLLPSGSTEKLDLANYLLSIYKNPGFRFERLSFQASLNDTLMLEALTRAPGDHITVKDTVPGGGAQIVQECIVQAISHTLTGGNTKWVTTYELSPYVTQSVFILNTSGLSPIPVGNSAPPGILSY